MCQSQGNFWDDNDDYDFQDDDDDYDFQDDDDDQWINGDGYEEDQELEDANFGDDGADNAYPIHLTTAQWDTLKKLHAGLGKGLPITSLLPLFHAFVKVTFTTQHPSAIEERFHTPVEAFIIMSSIKNDGSIAHPRNIANVLSVLQYLGLYMAAKECVESKNQIQCVIEHARTWILSH
jgi:hypothetical protein